MGIILEDYTSCEDLVGSEESLERNKKEKEYLDYINEHVLNVQKAYSQYFLPLLEKEHISDLLSDEDFKNAINTAAPNIAIHDASKYDVFEFNMYRAKYYPTSTEKADSQFEQLSEERYKEAWRSHYEHNWHHPEYWVDHKTGEIKDMQLDAIIEMICDWLAMSMKFNNNCRDWYFSDKASNEKSNMTDRTKQIVEDILVNVLSR